MKYKDAEYYIDIAAGEARARYVSEGTGQESTYMFKSQQAQAYKDAGYTGDIPPFIAAEASAIGKTPQEAADYILFTSNQWLYLAAEIERIRRTAKVNIGAMTDGNEISQACEETIRILNSI